MATVASSMAPTVMLIALAAPLPAQEPRCADYLEEIGATAGTGEDAYSLRGVNGNEELRCEGVFKVKTSGGPTQLTVVSFTRGPITYTLDTQLILEVMATPDVRSGSDPIAIRALPKAEGKNYQLDAIIPAAGRLVWPAGEVLESQGIGADQLGVYGTTRKGDQTVFIPLTIAIRGERPRPAANPPVLLAVRHPYTLSRLGWRVGRIDGAGECVSLHDYTWKLHPTGRKPIAIDLTGAHGDCVQFRLQRSPKATSKPAMLRVALPPSR
jgi:hypothetical protein